MKSTFLRLTTNDFLKGLLMAVIVPVLLIIQQSVAEGTLTFNWKQIAMAAIAGAAAYLLKNLFTDTNAAAKRTVERAGATVLEPNNAE